MVERLVQYGARVNFHLVRESVKCEAGVIAAVTLSRITNTRELLSIRRLWFCFFATLDDPVRRATFEQVSPASMDPAVRQQGLCIDSVRAHQPESGALSCMLQSVTILTLAETGRSNGDWARAADFAFTATSSRWAINFDWMH